MQTMQKLHSFAFEDRLIHVFALFVDSENDYEVTPPLRNARRAARPETTRTAAHVGLLRAAMSVFSVRRCNVKELSLHFFFRSPSDSIKCAPPIIKRAT